MLAEALDFLAAERFDHIRTAKRLGCNGSQLIKLLKKQPAAFQILNRDREAVGLSPLK